MPRWKTLFAAPACGVLLALLCTGPSRGGRDGCDPYDDRLRATREELDEFDRLVLDPLRRKRRKVAEQWEVETKYLESLRRQVGKSRGKLEQIERTVIGWRREAEGLRAEAAVRVEQAETLDQKALESDQGRSGRAREFYQQADRLRVEAVKLTAHAAKIERKSVEAETKAARAEAEVVRWETEVEAIETTPPSAAELDSKLRQLDAQLADEASLREERRVELELWEDAAQMCRELQWFRSRR